MPRLVEAVIVTFAFFCAVACGGSTTGTTSSPTTPAPDEQEVVAEVAENPEDTASGECSVLGSWRGIVPAGILANTPLTLVFHEDGTARGTAGFVSLDSTWEAAGPTMDITDVSANPAAAACPPDEVGHYTLAFEDGCAAVRVAEADDPCVHRRMSLTGFRATRQ